MEDVHLLSLQLFELVRQYEEMLKKEKDSSAATELRYQILEVESKLRYRKQELTAD